MLKLLNLRVISLFVFIIFSWGLAWPINKIGLIYMSPAWYTAIRLIIATTTMMGIVIALKKFSLPKRSDLPLIVIIGLLQISIYILFANIGLAYLPAGRSSLLAYTTPLWTVPAATWLLNEKTSRVHWMGFALGICGLVLLMNPWELDWTNLHIIFGSIMLLLASLCWAISMLCARYMKWTKSPLELIPWQLLIGTIPIIMYACLKEPNVIVTWHPALIVSLLYTGILVTGLSYWSGIVINRELPTTLVSVGFLIVPIFSLMVSSIFFHETINLTTSMAIGLIIAGLVCVVI